MAAMVIVMIVFVVLAGHHGFGGSHDGAASKAEPAHTHMQADRPAKAEEERR